MTFYTEYYTGADCTGSDGSANRVLTLNNEYATQQQGFLVFVNGLSLYLTLEYIPTHLSENSTVTFVNPLFDDQTIIVVYNDTTVFSTTANWATPATVRQVAGVSSTDFTDDEIFDLIALAQREVNSKVMMKVVREPIEFIDSYRSNKIDGSNTTYFARNWKGNWLADTNYDNVITTSDVTVTQYNPNTQTETQLAVSSISIPNCSVTLSAAPQNVQLFLTYSYMPFDPTTPDPFLSLATTYLAASYLFIGTDGFDTKFGNVSIKPGKEGGKGSQLYNKYLALLDQLNINSTGGAISGPMLRSI